MISVSRDIFFHWVLSKFESVWFYCAARCAEVTDSAYTWGSGTSMAAPHVIGVAAIYMADHPGVTPSQVDTEPCRPLQNPSQEPLTRALQEGILLSFVC